MLAVMDGTVMFKDRIGRRDPGPDSAAKGGAADRCSAVRALVMRRLIADVSAPVSDAAFRQRCGEACALGVYGVIVSPVRVALARKLCSAGGVRTVCLIGGSGESFLAVKRAEAAYALGEIIGGAAGLILRQRGRGDFVKGDVPYAADGIHERED